MTANTWTDSVWHHFRARHLTPLHRDVLLRLAIFHRGPGGRIYPSHATLAVRARCCVRTVQRALDAARALGLVSWQAIWVRAGWTSRRSSNAYTLETPQAVKNGANPDNGHKARETLRVKNPLSFFSAVTPESGRVDNPAAPGVAAPADLTWFLPWSRRRTR